MAKLLISGQANTGKTSLLQTLENVLVFANDGKKYPFPQPHINVPRVNTADEFIGYIENGLAMYEEKLGSLPEVIVFDSISKTLLDIEAHYIRTVNSFPYGQIGKDISQVMDYIENELAKNGCHIIFVSHAIKDGDGEYALVTAGGASGKRGGVIAEVDEAIYVDVRGKKRTIHIKNPKMLSRSLLASMPESVIVEEFSLKEYLDSIIANESTTGDWCLN
jgi:hypothetical protein